jgi:hypothetical protein
MTGMIPLCNPEAPGLHGKPMLNHLEAHAQEEQRHAKRLVLSLRVHLLGHDGRDEMLLSYDWSTHGVFLRACNPPPVGTVLEMYMVVGVPAHKVSLRGRVVRVRWAEDRLRGLPPGAGVHLEEVPASLGRLLDEASVRVGSLRPAAT